VPLQRAASVLTRPRPQRELQEVVTQLLAGLVADDPDRLGPHMQAFQWLPFWQHVGAHLAKPSDASAARACKEYPGRRMTPFWVSSMFGSKREAVESA
jgi:hypothetical protein